MENLEEDLTCSDCYSLFNDLRVLPCSHTFCKACLDNILQISTNFSIWRPLWLPLKCPNCRSMVELPPNGVDALPINIRLRAIIEKYIDGVDALLINICQRTIIEKYQRDSEPLIPCCSEHHRQPLNAYCVQDCKLICSLCLTVGQHQGHTIDDLQTAYTKERNTPARLVGRLTDKRWEEVCGLVEKLEQEKSRHEGLIRKDRKAVTQFFQGLERLHENKKEAFMKVLDKANEQLVCTYKPLIEKLKYMKEEQLELISIISSISEDESELVFLEKVHKLRDRVDALTKTELPEVPTLQISSGLEEFLKELWANVMIGRMEDSPVPKIFCHVKRHSTKEPQRASAQSLTVVAFLMVLLVLLLFWLNPETGASLGFSSLSEISQTALSLARELTLPLHSSGTFLYCLLHDLSLKFISYISAVGESTYQHVASFVKH